MEASGSAAAETGWLPRHLLLEDGEGRLMGAMPCYLKSHSYGEYVFDHGWADAYARAGGSYYPKLQSAVPFTPVTGKRLLVPEGPDRAAREAILLQAGATLTEQSGVSSLHVTFLTEPEWQLAGKLGWLQRTDQQFHWRNEGYASFEDFLNALASRKRKAIRKERREAREGGIDIEWVTGRDLTEAHWDAFFAFYMDTGSRKWGMPYLNRALLQPDRRDAWPIRSCSCSPSARAATSRARSTSSAPTRSMAAIGARSRSTPACISRSATTKPSTLPSQHKLARVEAGAQGEHKLARGYLPTPTYSAHYIADPGSPARGRRLPQARADRGGAGAALLTEDSPFRHDAE